MTIQVLTATQAIARLASFGAVIDARSPAEFAEDHLPGAVNWPVLGDAERKLVGTEYKQVSAFEASKRGAALVAKNIAAHIERDVMHQAKTWQPLVYCWRGGQRSGSMAWFLDQMGFRTHVLEGGYKAFRAAVMAELETLPLRLQFNVVCGRTGSGKTRLLGALHDAGAQVLDLEALASHRGSVLGMLPGRPQPSQKAFETAVWNALRHFDAARPVWVESESKKIGNLRVPEALIQPDARARPLPERRDARQRAPRAAAAGLRLLRARRRALLPPARRPAHAARARDGARLAGRRARRAHRRGVPRADAPALRPGVSEVDEGELRGVRGCARRCAGGWEAGTLKRAAAELLEESVRSRLNGLFLPIGRFAKLPVVFQLPFRSSPGA